MAETPIIQVVKLEARYGDATIIKDVNFDVLAGEIMVILGPSGCGKTTLLRHMIGLDRPYSGHIKIDGIDIADCSVEVFFKTLRKIGILFQTSALFGSMTLLENVALPILEYADLPADSVTRMAQIKLSQFDLEAFQDHLPSEISGGMKKRAGLARALALNPKILFLDEPTSGLDPIRSAEIDDLIRHINQTMGTTIIIITHDLDTVLDVAHRVIMLDSSVKGIIAQGKPHDLKDRPSHPLVRNFFNRQPATAAADGM
jgi:phospholipid/cholesterol/gamma-HCH transport system ATP-binding protein